MPQEAMIRKVSKKWICHSSEAANLATQFFNNGHRGVSNYRVLGKKKSMRKALAEWY